MDIEISGWAWLKKSELTAEHIAWFKKSLTITQKVSDEYKKRSKAAIVELWCEESDRFGVPREYFLDNMTKNHNVTYSVSRGGTWPEPSELRLFDIKNNIAVNPREEQSEAIKASVQALSLRPAAGCIITAPTAWGKTLFALMLARELKLKTAVLVHREFLLSQWRKRIEQYFPDAKIGVVAGKTYDVEDKHIVLVMIETVASWVKKNKIPDGFQNEFGLVISDEVHRVGAPLWGTAVPVFNSAYRLGISANPRRSDGLDKVFFWHIGQKAYTGTALMRTPKIRRVWSNFKLTHPRFNPAMMSMEYAFKLMSADPVYNQDVVTQVKQALQAGRKVLLYSHTVNHLKTLKTDVESQWSGRKIKIDFYIGGMTEDERSEAEDADLLLATYQMAKDSLDVPAIDTVVLAGPIRNPQQPAGRACREHPTKKDPIVVDMRADSIPIFKSYANSRDKFYERLYGDTYLQPTIAK